MPATFYFGLQPLLDRRKHTEEEKKHLCAQRAQDRDDGSAQLHALMKALETSTNALAAPHAPIAVSALHQREAHLTYLRSAIRGQRERVAFADAAFVQARSELAVAARERRIIEKLYERRWARYAQKAARREEAELDEANNGKRRQPARVTR